MSVEKWKKRLKDICSEANHLRLADSQEAAHELFMSSMSMYSNISYAIGGKENWKKAFQDLVQQDLDEIAKIIRMEEVEKYVNSLPDKGAFSGE